MIKKITLILLPVALIIGTVSIISHLSKKIYLWYQVDREIEQMKQQVNDLGRENRELTQKREFYQKDEFVKQEARQKLGLTAENETLIILPEIPDLSVLSPKGEMYETLTPIRQWQKLFFGK